MISHGKDKCNRKLSLTFVNKALKNVCFLDLTISEEYNFHLKKIKSVHYEKSRLCPDM